MKTCLKYFDFQHLTLVCFHVSRDMIKKLFPAPYYIWRYFLIFSVQVNSEASALIQNLLCFSLLWDQNVDTEMNVHRHKYITELILGGNDKFEKFPWYFSIHKSICYIFDISKSCSSSFLPFSSMPSQPDILLIFENNVCLFPHL